MPKMTNIRVLLVEPLRVHPLSPVKRSCDGVERLWNCDVVNVVWHEGICPDHQSIHGATLRKKIQVEFAILFITKSV